jgi:hypothetical protein
MGEKRNAEDLLKSVIAKIEGKKEDEVVLKDLSSSKKGPKKKSDVIKDSSSITLDSGEGLQITNVGTQYEDWRNIKSKKQYKTKNNIEEWGACDFFYFAKQLYQDKYHESWNLRVGGCSVEINKIRDKLSDICGFVSNLMMKDYIVFFFKNDIDYYKKNGGFYFAQMRYDRHIAYFIDHYDYGNSFASHVKKEKTDNLKTCSVNQEDIAKSYKVGDTTLLCSYGIVIALNWLVLNKKLSQEQAVKLVEETGLMLKANGLLSVVKNATEMYSPYPLWFPIRDIQSIVSKMGYNSTFNVKFVDGKFEQFIFLREKK